MVLGICWYTMNLNEQREIGNVLEGFLSMPWYHLFPKKESVLLSILQTWKGAR